MNREIKFRAWDKRINKWVAIGFHVLGEFNLFGGLGDHFMETKEITKVDSDIDRLSDIEVMQFTGLLDKKGKEIYESDIVRIWADPKHYSGYTGHDYVEAVVWNPERAQYKLTEHEFDDFEFIEVIGNIHENKDLLP